MEDFLTILKENTRENVYGIGAEDDIFWVTPYLAYYGENLEADFLPETSIGLKFYKELIDKYKVAPTKSQIGSSTLAQMFLEEKLAIYLSGRWMFPKISEKANFYWYVVEFPQGLEKQPCDVSGWAISKQSKHKESALKLVEFLSSKTSSEYFTSTGLIVPARVDVAQNLNNDNHNEKAFLNAINFSKSRTIPANYKKITDEINNKYLK
jgi:multiple sugar transport system substrate-binding protein